MPAFIERRDDFQQQLLSSVRRNLAESDRLLDEQDACGRLAVETEWYAAVRAAAIQADEELALRPPTSESVYFHPGHFYDVPFDGFLVASLIASEIRFSKESPQCSILPC